MPIPIPALSAEEWNDRYYDLQIGALYPVTFFFFTIALQTNGISGDSGTFFYLQAVYTPTNFIGLAGIDASLYQEVSYPVSALVSFTKTPTLVDFTTTPTDEGNILYQRSIGAKGLSHQKSLHANYYPGIIPVSSNVPLYVNMIAHSPTANVLAGTITLHTLQTGLQL